MQGLELNVVQAVAHNVYAGHWRLLVDSAEAASPPGPRATWGGVRQRCRGGPIHESNRYKLAQGVWVVAQVRVWWGWSGSQACDV